MVYGFFQFYVKIYVIIDKGESTMKLVGISGSLAGWKTYNVIEEVLSAAKKIDPTIETELIDLKDYEIELVNGSPLSFYNKDTWNVVQKIVNADLLVFGSPIYQASITGSLKNLLDHLPINGLKSKVTGIVTLAGSEKHFLVGEYQLRPILAYLKGIVPYSNVFVTNDAFDDESELVDKNIIERLHNLANEMIQLQQYIDKTD